MSSEARRVEHQMTDKGYVPVYTTSVIEQPWAGYTATDHAVWGQLFRRQREILQGRACPEFLDAMDALGMHDAQIPKFDDINEYLMKATGWRLIGVEGLLPELTFFEHLAAREFPVTWWIRRPDQIDYIAEPDLFHDLFGHVPLLMNPMFADLRQRAAGESDAAVLVHGRVRLDRHAAGSAHLRCWHPVLKRRVDSLSGIAGAEPHRI